MHNRQFFFRLAFDNVKKHRQFTFPYMLTFLITVCMFYMIASMSESLKDAGHVTMYGAMTLGMYVMVLFSVIFLFYTNSFLIRRRKKELGLYHILGMEKRHIAKVLFWENLMISVTATVVGVGVGIVFHKLLQMGLLRLAHLHTDVKFQVVPSAIGVCGILYGGIFVITFLFNWIQIARSKTVDLLKSEQQGEREPKSKWIMALLGVGLLVFGYWLALDCKSPLRAYNDFFKAVLIVIVATYLLFTSGSIVFLKQLRRNENYYYKAKHFTAVSGLLYRMKQNAVGLATICVLSSMVLVTLASTTCLYNGLETIVKKANPYDFVITFWNEDSDNENAEERNQLATLVKQNYEMMDEKELHCNDYTLFENGNCYETMSDEYVQAKNSVMQESLVYMNVIPMEDFQQEGGAYVDLKDNEILAYGVEADLAEDIQLLGIPFHIKDGTKLMSEFPGEDTNDNLTIRHYILVVRNLDIMSHLIATEKERNPGGYTKTAHQILFNVKPLRKIDLLNDQSKQIALLDDMYETMKNYCKNNESAASYSIESKASGIQDYYDIYGSILFLGLFLGTIFLMATVLIIYYKQVSEGYDDRHRFQVMQKVGMSKKEVSAAIRDQVRLVFFLPLLTAGVHICFAYPMVEKILVILNLPKDAPFVLWMVGTYLVFALIYSVVYHMTSKVYEKIVG